MLRRPLATVALAGLCVALLAVLGLDAENRLDQTSLRVSGTESARTEALLRRYFGDSEQFVVLLKGPPANLDAQGRRLVRVLNREPHVATISPWSRGGAPRLRLDSRTAAILVDFQVSLDEAVQHAVPRLDELLRSQVSSPVQAVQTGYASVSRALQDEAARATGRGELIALPLILTVLLLVFRSPVAACIPLMFGAATVVASRGALALTASWISIDAFALTASAMMGIALGVDYTLLVVSRFREELARGRSSRDAALLTRQTAGRTVAFAGGALLLSMSASAVILPGTFLVSLAGAVAIATVISVILGVLVLPALLALVGENVNRWAIGSVRKGASGPVASLFDAVLRRPGLAAVLLLLPLVLLTLPAVSLAIGPPRLDQLPSSNRARLDAELVNREVGPGWAAPYVVLATTRSGPITSEPKLAALRRWEREVRASEDVQAVIGPGELSGKFKQAGRLARRFLAQDRRSSQAVRLQRLGSHLGRAANAVGALHAGIGKAAGGAGLLSEGARNAGRGATVISDQLEAVATGGASARDAFDRLMAAMERSRAGQHRVGLGALALQFEVWDSIPRLRHGALLPARQLSRELAEVQSAVVGLEGIATTKPVLDLQAKLRRAIGRSLRLRSGLNAVLAQLRKTAAPHADRVVAGLKRLERGGRLLDSDVKRLASSTSTLVAVLPRLSEGAGALSDATGRIADGTASLQNALGGSYGLSRPLAPRLRTAATKASLSGTQVRRSSRRLRRLSPGVFDSGYFNLSLLDGRTQQGARTQAEQVVAVDRGGQAARILVVPKEDASPLVDDRLRATLDSLRRGTGGAVGVGGGPAELHDYAAASSSRLPAVIALVSVLTFLSLVILLRALIAPALTVLLNLLSVGVAFGVLALLADLPSGTPIGDWKYIDTIGAVAIFGISFGVSIDYSVFILMRMKEARERHLDHADAVRAGIRRTARVITGAAAMMIAVFSAFATADLPIVSQLGTGLTVAILVDAVVIRLILLPSLLLLVGERAWWLPAPVNRLWKIYM